MLNNQEHGPATLYNAEKRTKIDKNKLPPFPFFEPPDCRYMMFFPSMCRRKPMSQTTASSEKTPTGLKNQWGTRRDRQYIPVYK